MTVNTKEFLEEVKWISRFIEKRTTIPILANIAMVSNGKVLSLTGTELETAGVTSVPFVKGPEESAPIQLTVPIGLLIKVLTSLKSETTITLSGTTAEPEEVKEKDGTTKAIDPGATLTITSVSGESTIPGLNLWNYPCLPLPTEITCELRGLDVAAPRALVAISTEESRFTLNGALLHIREGGAVMVATDGHRLSFQSIDTDKRPKVHTIIRAKALSELAKMPGGKVWFSYNESHQWFMSSRRTIISRACTGNFPDYNRVLPKADDLTGHEVLSNAALSAALNKVEPFCEDRSKAIVYDTADDRVTIFANATEKGNCSQKMAVPGTRAVFYAGYDLTYIRDFLKNAPESVTFSHSTPDKAAVLSTPGWQYVVMPMRI